MTTGAEGVDLIAWAGALLNGDSAFMTAVPGGARQGVAPQNTANPVALLNVQSANELLTGVGANRIWTDAMLIVRISGAQDNFPATRTGAIRARALLHRATGGAQGSIIISCVLTQSFPQPEKALVNGVQWISYVQLYHVYVQ